MSRVIKSSDELRTFLETIVEQSVASAQDVVAEEERARQLELYRKMQEQEEVEEEEESEEVEEEPAAGEEPEEKTSKEDEKDPMQRPPASERAPEKPKSPEDVDSKNILYSINQIRSGRSLKDRSVKDNLNDYFNRLNPVERLALSEFLEGLSDVIVDGVPAADAETPDEEVVMQATDATAKEVEKKRKAQSQNDKPQAAEKSPAPEDIAPPIKVAQ